MPGSSIAGNLVAFGIHALFIGNVVTPLRVSRCIRTFTRTNHAASNESGCGPSTPMAVVAQRSRGRSDGCSCNDCTGKIFRGSIVAGLADGLIGITAAEPIFLCK